MQKMDHLESDRLKFKKEAEMRERCAALVHDTYPDEECGVCTMPIIGRVVTLKCGHRLHDHCLMAMISEITTLTRSDTVHSLGNEHKILCPMCRQETHI